jgi:hypothetical protein
MQWRTGPLRVPSPSFGGWSLDRQSSAGTGWFYSLSTRCSCRSGRCCWVITYSVRVAPVVPIPGSKPTPAMDAAPSTGTSQPVTKIRRNITTLYHKYLESRCVHTQTHVIRRCMKKDEQNCLVLKICITINNESA